MTTGKIPLKEQALNPDRVAREVQAVHPAFNAGGFIREVVADLPHLELKARIARTSQGLHDHLSLAGDEALETLLRSLPPTPEAAGVTNDFGLHIYSPHSDYVARYCRTPDYLGRALDALRTFTRYFTAEDAVRYFLNDYPKKTLEAVHAWARDHDSRVRRLASESTRPKLPWSPRIALPVDAGLGVLEQLYADSSRYVTQSVANHLRDIAATDPDLVLSTLARWRASRQTNERQLTFIAREALKTLLKKGWSPAYAFLGFASDAPIEVATIRMPRSEIRPGESLVFETDLSTKDSLPLHVTYVISSTTQRGARREKVYFLCRATSEPGRILTLSKTHHLRTTAATTITPGTYTLAIQVNGRRYPETQFRVV